jgi:hypothetical protein
MRNAFRIIVLLSVMCGCVMENPEEDLGEISRESSSYGLYGTVWYWDSYVQSPTVYVDEWNGYSWVYVGSTPASLCGYYTYDTGHSGHFRVRVAGTYGTRHAGSCSSSLPPLYLSGSDTEYVGGWDLRNFYVYN